MKFNVSEKKKLTLFTDIDCDIVELNDGFCAYRMSVKKRYMQEPGRLEREDSHVREGISETAMMVGENSEAGINDVLSWHQNFRPQMYLVDEQFFEDLKNCGNEIRRLHERVPQDRNFDFIKSYEGTLTVLYYDERLKCYTDVTGVLIPKFITLKLSGDEYDLARAIEHLQGFDNVKPYEGEYKIETAPSGERMVWLNWLGSVEEMEEYINPHGSNFRPYYVLNELLGLEQL